MTQLAFDLEALDDTRVRDMFSCGVHQLHREPVEHWEDCYKLRCPRCGETATNGWMGENNHGSVEWRAFCGKQINLLNHAARCRMILDGTWPHDLVGNCFAAGHDHSARKSGSHFASGVPIECVAAELAEKTAWLLEHGVHAEEIGTLGQWAHRQAEQPLPHNLQSGKDES